MTRPVWILLLLVALISPLEARADSDGYFCLGPDYVAYQFGMAPLPVKPHWLYVVRYGAEGISEPDSIQLPQFQVRGMRCRADAVDVASWFAVHTVAMDSFRRPVAVTEVPLPHRGAEPGWPRKDRNLTWLDGTADWREPRRETVHSDPDGSEYLLEIAAVPDSIRECPPIFTARIIQMDPDRREIAERILFRSNTAGEWACRRPNLAPVDSRDLPAGNPLDILLEALLWGVRERINVSVYEPALRAEFAEYLWRADAYRTPRPPVVDREMQMVDAVRVEYERRLVSAATDTGVTALAVAYVDSLGPCYEWEGMSDCPEREALFADEYLINHPDSPFSAYLPLLAAHRWLCAAEAFEGEERHTDAARGRRISGERLAIVRASDVLLIREAAEQLARRGRC